MERKRGKKLQKVTEAEKIWEREHGRMGKGKKMKEGGNEGRRAGSEPALCLIYQHTGKTRSLT